MLASWDSSITKVRKTVNFCELFDKNNLQDFFIQENLRYFNNEISLSLINKNRKVLYMARMLLLYKNTIKKI